MAYTVGTLVETASPNTGQTIVESPNFTAVAGDVLIAIVSYFQSTALTIALSDTVGTNDSWGEMGSGYHNGYTDAYRAFYRYGVGAGSCTIRATFSGDTADYPAIVVFPVTGLENGSPTDPFDQIVWASQASPGTATDAVTVSSGSLATQPAAVFGFCRVGTSNDPPAIGTGFTNIGTFWIGAAAVRARLEHKRVTSTAATAATFTAGIGTDQHRHAVFIMKESTGTTTLTGTTLTQNSGTQAPGTSIGL